MDDMPEVWESMGEGGVGTDTYLGAAHQGCSNFLGAEWELFPSTCSRPPDPEEEDRVLRSANPNCRWYDIAECGSRHHDDVSEHGSHLYPTECDNVGEGVHQSNDGSCRKTRGNTGCAELHHPAIPIRKNQVITYKELTTEQREELKLDGLPVESLDNVLLSCKPLPYEAGQQVGKFDVQGVTVFAGLADVSLSANDELLTLNATLEKSDRACIVRSIEHMFPEGDWEPVSDGPFSGLSFGHEGTQRQVFVPQADGSFYASEFAMPPDPVVVDLSTGFDFSKSRDRNYAAEVLGKKPRLIIMELSPDDDQPDFDGSMHSRWVYHLALRQHNQGGGFLITKSDDNPSWSHGQAQLLRNLPNVQFTPLSACKLGLVSCQDQEQQSGILTNVGDITYKIRTESDAITKQHGSIQNLEHDGRLMFSDVLKKLDQEGHIEWRGSFMTWRA